MDGTENEESEPNWAEMIKSCFFTIALMLGAAFATASSPGQDATPHHAAMHAEHWVDHHVSAPHKHVVKHIKHDKSTHHAAVHAEHWLNHHLSAPHKKNQ